MKIKHRVPVHLLGKSDPITPEYQAEVDKTVARAEAAHRRAMKRLRSAEKRLTQARESQSKRHHIATLEALVELRRVELEQLHRLMVATGAPSTSRGTKSRRHINQGGVL